MMSNTITLRRIFQNFFTRAPFCMRSCHGSEKGSCDPMTLTFRLKGGLRLPFCEEKGNRSILAQWTAKGKDRSCSLAAKT
jgi:hypothetical protein